MEQQLLIPRHVGIILDGNRRWASENGLSSLEGHRQGYQSFKSATKYAFNKGIAYLSVFVFSTENWERTKDEVKFLMDLALRVLTKDLAEIHKSNIKIVWLGSVDKLSTKLIKAIVKAEEKTKDNDKGTLCLCFNYGGQQEIVDAVKKIVSSKVSSDDINKEVIEQALYAPQVPPVDLLIRTSGEHRISGFMLYRTTYSELYFIDKYWPDFNENDMDMAINEYTSRQRRFGK